MNKIIEKIIELTSIVEVDEEGVEHKKPWTLEEFIIGNIYMIAGVVLGAILF